MISKTGSVGPKEFGKLTGLFNKDVLDDFHKDFGKAYGNLEKSGQIISDGHFKRKGDDLTIADLTGIATQDIQISKFVLDHM